MSARARPASCSAGSCVAGDAAHIVPPTGAKDLNLAADVQALADALQAWHHGDDRRPLEAYSTTCLDRVWRAQHVASWMTTALHRNHDSDDELEGRLQVAQLACYCSSRAGALTIAENFVRLDPIARCDGSMV